MIYIYTHCPPKHKQPNKKFYFSTLITEYANFSKKKTLNGIKSLLLQVGKRFVHNTTT